MAALAQMKSDVCIREIYDASKKRRVLIIRRENGTFGYDEEYFSEEPLERCWISRGRFPLAVCDTESTALLEAMGRIEWLAVVLSSREHR